MHFIQKFNNNYCCATLYVDVKAKGIFGYYSVRLTMSLYAQLLDGCLCCIYLYSIYSIMAVCARTNIEGQAFLSAALMPRLLLPSVIFVALVIIATLLMPTTCAP